MQNVDSSVIIVGGGASAVFVTAAIQERAAEAGIRPPRVTVVGREPTVGRGLAYGHAAEHHRLNSPAGSMSLSAADPTGFVQWITDSGWHDVDGETATRATFMPRRVFGDYVENTFAGWLSDPESGVSFVQGDVTGVETTGDSAVVSLATGEQLDADRVVLALGNPAPQVVAANAHRTIDDPWATGALDGISATDRVLLVGTGLTMIDVATSLARRLPEVRMTATSRHLLLPAVHLSSPATPGPGLGDEVSTLGGMISAFGRQVRDAASAGAPWQAVIDGMRPQMQALWQRLSGDDRARFLRLVARRWEVYRHRMAPRVWAELSSLIDAGTLTLKELDELGEPFDVAINCTGPASVATRGWNPLVDSLLDNGTLVPDPTGIGVDADSTGAVLGTGGMPSSTVYTIGAALKGALWETVAVPELRLVAYRIADDVLRSAVAV